MSMLARIHKAMAKKDDKGFTLIELLVVVIIIGILAAIAIPVFMNQRKSAMDAGVKSDLRTVANEAEMYYVDNQEYPATATSATGTLTLTGAEGATPVEVKLSNDKTVVVFTNAGDEGYTITGTNPDGTKATYLYDSSAGGLQDEPVTEAGTD
jgi:prepilin-type N-terminal cleavage/methylation domain-containing protein